MKKKPPSKQRSFSLFCYSVGSVCEIVSDVSDSYEILSVFIVYCYAESLFAEHNEVGEFKRIDTEIVYEFSGRSYIVSFDGKFFYEQIFYLFKHHLFLRIRFLY